MPGNMTGGKRAAQTNKRLYGKDFYKRIGAKGGKVSKRGGFASYNVGKDGLTGRERARRAGKKGGEISKRLPVTDRGWAAWRKKNED